MAYASQLVCDCVVPENIHNLTTEDVSRKQPPPPLNPPPPPARNFQSMLCFVVKNAQSDKNMKEIVEKSRKP